MLVLIWSAMVHRLFLTLLALLTGLAAQIGPAEARLSQATSVQVVASRELVAAKAPKAPVALARLPEPGLRNTRLHAPPRIVAPAPVVVATVLTGIDRARE
ncbi:hypothetical protein [Novosphingobium sp. BL-52-GroH]|uniref:hypothetical protein n=1 Tax=Novosphingobium sp. BL-52-GroH TaxID=3349877 RepID=UPI00384FD285